VVHCAGVRPDHTARLRALDTSSDAAVLQACRDALAHDAELARLLVGLLWQRHLRLVETVARRHFREEWQEVVGETSARVVRYAYARADVPDNWPALLATMTRRAAQDLLRQQGRHSPERNGDAAEDVGATDPDLAGVGEGEDLARHLERLSPRDREMIESQLDDEPADAVAARLSLSVTAVHVARHRARARLRTLLLEAPR